MVYYTIGGNPLKMLLYSGLGGNVPMRCCMLKMPVQSVVAILFDIPPLLWSGLRKMRHFSDIFPFFCFKRDRKNILAQLGGDI